MEKRLLVLEKENAVLQVKLRNYENPKNSRNSSVPTSKDENHPLKANSLRADSDHKVGG